jgi:hypothetical protein
MTDVIVIAARKPRISRRALIRVATLVASAVLLAGSSQAYSGRPVTLRGAVGCVYGPQVFSLDDGAGPGVLIVVPGELEDSVAEGLEVIVTGTARVFVDEDVSSALGSLDAPPEIVATLSRLVVVARTATRADGTTLLRPSGVETSATGNGVVRGPTGSEVTRGVTGTPATNGPTSTDVTRGTTGTDVTRGATGTDATNGPTTRSLGMPGRPPEVAVSADRIAASPDRYVGRRVLLTADVSAVESEDLFTLEPAVAAPEVVLVLNPRPLSSPAMGAGVTVSGTVRRFSREELGPLGQRPAEAEALLARYSERPVVVADSIRTSDGRQLVEGSSLR